MAENGKVLDRMLGVEVELSDDARGCDYQGHEFGASYPDSVCIDGMLWDADSGGADGYGWNYTFGGDIPCPWCNHAEWLGSALDDLESSGYDEHFKGVSRDSCRHPEHSRFECDAEAMRAAWQKGWDAGAADACDAKESGHG